MVNDHSDSERGNPLPPHGLLFSNPQQGLFYMHHPTDRITHTTAFVTPLVEHWLEREIAQWRIDPTTHRTMNERSYHGATSRSLAGSRLENDCLPELITGSQMGMVCGPGTCVSLWSLLLWFDSDEDAAACIDLSDGGHPATT